MDEAGSAAAPSGHAEGGGEPRAEHRPGEASTSASLSSQESSSATLPENDFLNVTLCIVGDSLKNNTNLQEALETLKLPVVYSETGEEYANGNIDDICFVMEHFDGPTYDSLYARGFRIFGPMAIMASASGKVFLWKYRRPLHNSAMANVVLCFSGIRRKQDLTSLFNLVHHMGGSVHKNFSSNVTHLVAGNCNGEKYRYAMSFGIPIMAQSWVHAVWDRRDEPCVSATDKVFMEHRLKPFFGARIYFLGFSPEETAQMASILTLNGGTLSALEDSTCTHIVVDDQNVISMPENVPPSARVVKAEWFWATVQMVACVDEQMYLFEEHLECMSPKPNSYLPSQSSRKRKRLKDTVSALAQVDLPVTGATGPAHKRRSSVGDVAMLSMSGSFLDSTLTPEKVAAEDDIGVSPVRKLDLRDQTPRQRVFMELLQTESNYVAVLNTIMKLFKDPLEATDQIGGPLLDPTELKIIFGNLPPIHEVHTQMLGELKHASTHWRDDMSVGSIILKYYHDLLKAYPPFINFFENTKEMLQKCDDSKPRFHAFLKIAQSKPECGRQTLQELLIRPVQRLPSVSLLLNDIVKHTAQINPDHSALEKALARIKDVMTHINEDKRKTEGQLALFDIFNDIENCPAHLVSSHRSFITRCDVLELSDGLCGKGDQLVFFLFSDVMEICKKRSKAFNSHKSPSVVNLQAAKITGLKPYKHIELMALSNIKRVVDIRETEDCHNVFAFVCRSNQELKERLHTFTLVGEEVNKASFLRTLCRQMANSVCRADSENFLTCLDPHQLDIETSEINVGALSKAVRFASKTRQMVGRALSFNKTPSRLKRAVSQMMSPFGERATDLNQLRLGSCQSLAEVDLPERSGTMPRPVPSTPQPPRKTKSNSYGYTAIK